MTHPNPPDPAKPSAPGPKPPATLDARGLPVGYPFQPDWEVTPRQVREMLTGGVPDLLLVDCRREDEWEKARIEGAVLVPMEEVAARLDEIEGPGGERDRPIVVHCHMGKRALKVTALLRTAGFSDVKSMAGGIEVWSLDIDPRVPRY